MTRRGPLVAGAAAAIVVLLAAVLLVLPKVHQVGATRDELAAAQDESLALQAQLNALREARRQAPQTEKQIKQIQGKVPTTADLPRLFGLLQDAADTAAVDFFSFSPGVPVADPTGTYSTLGSAISVTGSYVSLEEFLRELETLDRAAKVTAISLAPQGSTGETTGETSGETTGELQMQISVEFYTTDTSAGPGSIPGPTEGSVPVPVVLPSPTPTVSPSPAVSPSATISPTPGT